jgi:hypothetical protein
MAFQHKNLSVVAYANGFTIWHYKTEDQLEELLNGYFDAVSDLMNKNDMLVLNCGDQNCIMFVKSIEDRKVKLG